MLLETVGGTLSLAQSLEDLFFFCIWCLFILNIYIYIFFLA